MDSKCPVCDEEFNIVQIDTGYIITHLGFLVKINEDEIQDGIDSMVSIINTHESLGRSHNKET